MRYSSIRNHLKPYLIVARRRTTINHAFASAIAPSDAFDEAQVRKAMIHLGQDPDKDLKCAYCDAPAKTWDHVFATVKNSRFSGYGHRLGNLLPCCKSCNSAKGNKSWEAYLTSLGCRDHSVRAHRISTYLAMYKKVDSVPANSMEYARLTDIRQKVLDLLEEADVLAKKIRERTV